MRGFHDIYILLQISELRASVSRCEQQAAWREERMKQEVGDMQRRLQEAETRNQELTTSISQSELLRHIVSKHLSGSDLVLGFLLCMERESRNKDHHF